MTTYTPTAELLATPKAERIEWAEALESGRYRQGHQTIYNLVNGTYCCIGVKAMIDGVRERPSGLVNLPDYSAIRLGLRKVSGVHVAIKASDTGRKMTDFIDLNDIYKLTFPQIAQLLRGNTVTTS